PKPEPGRSRWIWWAIGTVIVVLVAAVFWLLSRSEATSETAADGARVNTATVALTDLTDETTYSGTLGRPQAEQLTAGTDGTVTWVPLSGTVVGQGEPLLVVDDSPVLLVEGDVPAFRDLQLGDTLVVLPAGRSGVLTWLAGEGQILENGSTIARIDEEPVVILEGEIPMYRTLREGVEGEDVEQLESALVALGFDPDGDVVIDREFDNDTENMVELWQEELGIDETGRVDVGDIIFAPVPGQVVAQQSPVGTAVSPTTPIVQVSGGDYLSGTDIVQLEAALEELGYEPGFVDGTYDSETARAVSDWTGAVGHGEDGRLPLGSIVFRPGGLRIGEILADPGTAVGPASPVLTAASLETIVRMDLPAQDQELVTIGTVVVVELPDQSEVPGVVTYVSGVATSGTQGGPATFEVEIALDDPSVADGLDEAPVNVMVVTDSVEGVLAVPVSALLALAEGGYAVEVVTDGSTRLVAVEAGFFADGLVEIAGAIEAGDVVVTP
ncbi:MAG: peptidoglycan-binding protein, partial [Acidimicrobiia bacterium]